jgi:hypothetical protein
MLPSKWKWVEAWQIGVHLSDNHTEYFELMSHITGAGANTTDNE